MAKGPLFWEMADKLSATRGTRRPPLKLKLSRRHHPDTGSECTAERIGGPLCYYYLFIRFFSQSTLTFYTYLCDHPNCRSICEIIPLLGDPPTPPLPFLSNTQFNVSLCYLWWGSHLMGIAVPRCKIGNKKIAQIPKGIEIEDLFLESPSNPLIYRSIDRFDSSPNVMLLTSWYLVHVLPNTN